MKFKSFLLTGLCIASVLIFVGCTKKANTETDSTSENTVEKSHYTLSDRTRYQEVDDGYFTYTVTPSGEVYMKESTLPSELGGRAKGLSGDTLNTYEQVKASFQTYTLENYLGNRGPVDYTGLKLDISGVLSAYTAYKGNGGFQYTYFVKEGGKVAYLCSGTALLKGISQSMFTPKLIEDLENVVSICENWYGNIPYAVCADGTEVELSGYNY